MQEFKIYKLETKENFIIYLRRLIQSTYTNMEMHKRYLGELKDYISENKIEADSTKKINPYIYMDFKNKISGPSNMLLNLIGDESKSAMSYKKFRAMVKKRQANGLDLGLLELNEEITNILNQCNVNRNWALHIPESLLTAEREYVKFAKDITGSKDIYNPIKMVKFSSYDAEWLINLLACVEASHEIYQKSFQQMKKDYSILLGESVSIVLANCGDRPLDDIGIAELSMNIQTGKYKKRKNSK